MKLLSILLICCIIILSGVTQRSKGQNTSISSDPEKTYRLGVELFNKEKYGAAQQQFEQVYQNLHLNNSELKINSAYYIAICALALFNNDAEYLINQFILKYPYSSKINRAYFQLGKLQFRNKDYRNAIKSFNKVNLNSLSSVEKNEYYFKKAFSLLQSKKSSDAKELFAWLKDKESKYQNAAAYYYAHILYSDSIYSEAYNEFVKIRDDETFGPLVPYYLLQIYYYQNEFEKIIIEGTEVMDMTEGSKKAAIARLIGDAYYRKNDYKNAMHYLEVFKNNRRERFNRNDHYQLGMTYYKNGEYENAISHFQDVIDGKDSVSQNAYYHLADCYLETGKKKHAANSFFSVYKLGFDKNIKEDALFNYAKLNIETTRGPYNEPIKIIEQYINEYPESERIEEANNLLVELFLSTKNYQAAIESFKKIKNPSEKLKKAYQKINYYRGVELFNDKRFKKAIELFKIASEYNYNKEIRTESNFWIGEANYLLGNNWASLKYYNEFRRSPYSKNTKIYNYTNYNLGYLYFNRKKYNDAVKYFKNFINNEQSENPRLIFDATLRLGDCYFINKNYDLASKYYDLALNMDYDSDVDYALYKKAMCFNDYSNYKTKVSILESLIDKYPKSPYVDKALYEIGSTEEALDDNRRAIYFYRKILDDHPRSSLRRFAMLKLGLIYYSNDQYVNAIDFLKLVVEKYPNTNEAKSAISSLENIYVEMNKVDEFLDYTKDNPDSDISISAQDSLLFNAAENQYMRNDCNSALPSLKNYLKKFPDGFFSTSAHYYIADCELRSNNLDTALFHYNKVTNVPNTDYIENALLNAALISDQLMYYDSSYRYYSQLEKYAENNTNINISLEGQMRSSFKTKQHKEAIEASKKLLKNNKVTNSQIIQSHFILGKSYFALNDFQNAKKELVITSKLTNNEIGAESTYLQALIDYKNADYKNSEEIIFRLNDDFSSYNYWVAKGFILLADVYIKQSMLFEARETLNSIIENYPDNDLKNIALEKLQSIIEMDNKTVQEIEQQEEF